MTNLNHPKKGSQIKVEPIRYLKDIKAIKKLLKDNSRDLALFTLGINTNLRASDLVNITVKQVMYLKAGDDLVLKEQKTGKERRISLNASCITAIQTLLDSRSVDDDDPLFKSRKGSKLLVQSIHRLIKGWCSQINLNGNYGSHTLRKTWGFHQRVTFGSDLPTLMECFNHATQRQTMKYLCVQPDEIKSIYANEL